VCRFHVAAGTKLRPGQGAIHTLSGAVAKLASINLLKFGSFSYRFDKPWFHSEGRLAAVLITPSLGVSNWAVIYKTPTSTPHHQLPLHLPPWAHTHNSNGYALSMDVLFLHWRIEQQACKGRYYLSLSAWNMNPSIQPLEFPKYAWTVLSCLYDVVMILGSASLPWFNLSSTSLPWSFSYLLVCNFRFGLLTNGELAPFSHSQPWVGRFYELLLLTSGLKAFLWACSEKIVSEFVWKKGYL
jgi:hypothetical protein